MRNRHMDNRGMSLVELLLAVTILAIIVVPLLHAFISSAQLNKKSKEAQRLTILGQDIMEGLKAYSAEDLAYEFSYTTPGDCGNAAHAEGFQLLEPKLIGNATTVRANVFELYKSGANYRKCDSTSAGDPDHKSVVETTVGGVTDYKFIDISSDPISPTVREKKYYYAITDVTSDSGASSAFKSDVLIEIDPTKYKASGG
nr:prepilin-type N-terminal cleavage/methylation domain-containing protein [Lachnospiraceae bacterium]